MTKEDIITLITKISNDPYQTSYHNTYTTDLEKFQDYVYENHRFALTIEQCCIIWEKLSSTYAASFLGYDEDLARVALTNYMYD